MSENTSHPIKYISLDSISVENRYRKSFPKDKQHDLKLSIKDLGLLTPLIVVETDQPDRYILLAGERRLRAIIDLYAENTQIIFGTLRLPMGDVPAVVYPYGTSVLTTLEIEKQENSNRVDFAPLELAAITKRIYEQYKEQQGVYSHDNPTGVTRSKIASTLYGKDSPTHQKQISQALRVAAHIDNPILKDANPSTMKDALKIVHKLDKAAVKKAIFYAVSEDDSGIEENDLQLISGDFLKNWQNLSEIDVVLCDPPYGIQINSTIYADTQKFRRYDDSYEYWKTLMEGLWSIFPKICKEDAYVFIFCDFDRYNELLSFVPPDFVPCPYGPLIWHKGNLGMSQPSKPYPRNSTEYIALFRRGQRSLLKIFNSCITDFPKQPESVTGHPDGKPKELYEYILKNICYPRNKVLDPCCGHGPIFWAAHRLNLKAYGFEKDRNAFRTAYMNIKKWQEEELDIEDTY